MLDLERALWNPIPLSTVAARSNIHLVSRQPYHEDIDFWSAHDPHKP